MSMGKSLVEDIFSKCQNLLLTIEYYVALDFFQFDVFWKREGNSSKFRQRYFEILATKTAGGELLI